MPLAPASDLSVNLKLFRSLETTNHYLRSSKIDGKLMAERIGNEIVEGRFKQTLASPAEPVAPKREEQVGPVPFF